MSGDHLEVMRQEIYSFLDSSLPRDNRVAEAMRYSVLSNKGSLWRPLVTASIGRDYHLSLHTIVPIAAANECAHVASLILDDIQDHSPTRRGSQSCHEKYSQSVAELAVIDLLVQGRKFIRGSDVAISRRNQILEESDIATSIMIHGQDEDNASESNPTVNKIIQMYSRKSGALFALSAVSGGIAGRATDSELKSLRSIGFNTGICYQIADDFNDRFEDEREGKKTLLSIIGDEETKKIWRRYFNDIRGQLIGISGTKEISLFGDVITHIVYGAGKKPIDTTA